MLPHMKNVILFGIGDNGRAMVDAYLKYEASFHIVAVADNNSDLTEYRGIPVIKACDIDKYGYDEIWIASIYYNDIKRQLIGEMKISRSAIRYVEFPAPFLEDSIYTKYKEELTGNRKCENSELQEILEYISNNQLRMFNYSFYDEYYDSNFEVILDEQCGMYYGDYMGHKMYMSRKFDNREKAVLYFRNIVMEQDKRSPHCYLTNDFEIEQDSVGIDIGAAEGIFALSIIDRVKHIYLIEADGDWCEALQYTFREYQDKVTVLQTYASEKDSIDQKRLDTLFENKDIDFIKMDIEGAELSTLKGAINLLKNNFPKLAVCTYHNANDNAIFRAWLENIGYNSLKNSRGYVVCMGEWELEDVENVDFRRALLFAERI
jgi:hypothetical protein